MAFDWCGIVLNISIPYLFHTHLIFKQPTQHLTRCACGIGGTIGMLFQPPTLSTGICRRKPSEHAKLQKWASQASQVTHMEIVRTTSSNMY